MLAIQCVRQGWGIHGVIIKPKRLRGRIRICYDEITPIKADKEKVKIESREKQLLEQKNKLSKILKKEKDQLEKSVELQSRLYGLYIEETNIKKEKEKLRLFVEKLQEDEDMLILMLSL